MKLCVQKLVLFSAVVLLVSLTSPSMAQTDEPYKGPWLGPARYTISIADTLPEVVKELRRVTKVFISGPHGPRPEPPGQTQVGGWDEVPVSLEFEDATLSVILYDLCSQVGLVYEAAGGGRHVTLRVGDPEIDGRPTVRVGEYTLRIGRMSVVHDRHLRFRWGAEPTGEPSVEDILAVSMTIVADTQDALEQYAGIAAGPTGVTDTGAVCDGPTHAVERSMWGSLRGREGPLSHDANLRLDAPPDDATELARLEGNLMLFEHVQQTRVKIPPGSEGKTIEKDGINCVVKKWSHEGSTVRVELESTLPLGEPATSIGRRTCSLRLVTAKGAQLPGGGSTSGGTQNGRTTWRQSMQFSLPEGDDTVDHLELTVTERGEANKLLPFVFEHVPLP